MTTKMCRTCNEEKVLEDFYKHPRMMDGRLNHCKPCKRAYANKHRDENLDRIRAYDRRRAKEPGRLEHLRQNVIKQKARYPEKVVARTAVGNAIRDGRLIRCKCERCSETVGVHAHHEDYSKPLDVMWLCPICHAARHKELRKTQLT